jgi:hypothetical protein
VFVAWKVLGVIEYCATYVALPAPGQSPPVEVYGTTLEASVFSDVVELTYVTATVDVETVMLQTVVPNSVTLIERQVVPSACFPPGAVAAPDDPVASAEVMVTVHAHADVVDVATIDAVFPPFVVQPLNVGGANETDGPEAAVVPAAAELVQVTWKFPALNTAEPVSAALNAVLTGVIVIAAAAGPAVSAMTAVNAATASGSALLTYLIVRSPSSS